LAAQGLAGFCGHGLAGAQGFTAGLAAQGLSDAHGFFDFGAHGFDAAQGLAAAAEVFPKIREASVALRNCIDLSCDQWIAGISPLKGSSFFVVYSDEVHELFNQLLPGFENPAPDHFSGQNAKPNFNLV